MQETRWKSDDAATRSGRDADAVAEPPRPIAERIRTGASSAFDLSGRMKMQNKLMVVVIGLAASAVFAAAVQFQPLNVNTGLWHITKAVTWTSLPPQMAAMMRAAPKTISYNSCVTAQSLSSNPWANGSGDTCTWTVLTSTSTDMEVQGAGCNFGDGSGMTGTVHGTIHIVDPQHGTGSMAISLSGNGQSMQGTASYTGQWVSATCPAH
jgi:hypothetical protein